MIGSEIVFTSGPFFVSLIDVNEYIKQGIALLHLWSQSITNPRQFLVPFFQPTEAQLLEALKFHLVLLAISFVLFAPFLLSHKGDLAEKLKLAAAAIVQLLTLAAVAICWYFAFWLFGGGASFSGTYLAFVYGGAPYIPLVSFASLVMWGALPSGLRRYAMDPLRAQAVMKIAMQDPRTKKGGVIVGSLLVLGITFWSLFVVLRCINFVNSLGGWRLVGAIVLALPIFGFVGYIQQFVQSIFIPAPETTDTTPAVPASQPDPVVGLE